MVNLTTEQSELLYEVAERHLQWYKIYYDVPPAFEVLLELNHRKLSYKIGSSIEEELITTIIQKMLQDYNDLIKYYGKGSD